MDARVADSSPKQEIRLADYQPPAFLVQSVHLTFRIHDRVVAVMARSRIKRQTNSKSPLELDGGPYMTLASVSVDGRKLSASMYQQSEEKLIIPNVPDEFLLEIETELLPFENTRLEGLYASGGNICTQCEAEGFRHITYYPDRPDVLAVYDVRIEADREKYPVLLSNGNLQDEGPLEGGRHFAHWHDPHPKPCYLFAVVAGKLSAFTGHYQTKSGREVDLNIYVREHDLDKCDHAMQSLKRSMKWDEDIFDLEYDLDTYNIVAVSDFNMGAMENKGLNIFNTKYVLANTATATDSDFDHVEGVIGHEYFHNWTGNRVTCRDWFQLSLKEGLTVYRDQEFSSDMTSRPVKRIEDVKVLRMLQFPEDAGPLAHPIRPESYIEINNFYTTTVYNKGAEVIRMMSRILGQGPFREGVKHYLSRHDGEAATCEDFVCAMEHVSGVDLSQFRLWYSQAGTPILECRHAFKDGKMLLTLNQSCPATPDQPRKAPMHIPVVVGWLDATGRAVDAHCSEGSQNEDSGTLLHLTEAEQTFEFTGCQEGAVPSFLRGFSAPVKLQTDLSDQDLALLFSHDTDPFARWQAGQDLYASYLLSSLSDKWRSSDEGMNKLRLIMKSIGAVLADMSLDNAFAAELLALPSEVYLGQLQEIRDPDGIHKARNRFIETMVEENWETITQRYSDLGKTAVGRHQQAKASRKYRNLLLGLMPYAREHNSVAREYALKHFQEADNMTDQFASLTALCHGAWPERPAMLEKFYDQWRHEELVIDKWFSAQALSPDADAKQAIPNLMRHQAFSMKNPNRLRSVVSMFAMMNQVNFHADDGSGYNLLSKVITEVDGFNPQTAARMVAPLGRWAQLDAGRQQLMKRSLNDLLAKKELSDDVRELVEKSLR